MTVIIVSDKNQEEVTRQEAARLRVKFLKWIEQHDECLHEEARKFLQLGLEKVDDLEMAALVVIGAQFMTYEPGDCVHGDEDEDEDEDEVISVTVIGLE